MKYNKSKNTFDRNHDLFCPKNTSMALKLLYRLIFNLRLIKLFSNWYIYFFDKFHLLRNKKIIYELRNGIKFKIWTNKGDFHIINSIFNAGVYNKLLRYITDNSIVIDIGAHIGIFSVLAGKIASEVRVYSYEPFEGNFNLLKENITINNLEGNIIPFQNGVCGKKGNRTLLISKKGFAWHSMFNFVSKTSHSTFGKSDKGIKKINIKCTTLKDIFDSNKISRCHFLKMNCEGAEYEILFNTPPSYLKRIDSMTIEYHPSGDIKKLIKFLENNGFIAVIEVPRLANYPLLYIEKLKK